MLPHPVTYCTVCDTLTKHVEGEVEGYTKDNAPQVLHSHCRITVNDNTGEEYYLPFGVTVPAGFMVV